MKIPNSQNRLFLLWEAPQCQKGSDPEAPDRVGSGCKALLLVLLMVILFELC